MKLKDVEPTGAVGAFPFCDVDCCGGRGVFILRGRGHAMMGGRVGGEYHACEKEPEHLGRLVANMIRHTPESDVVVVRGLVRQEREAATRECIARVCETTVASKMQIDVRPGELVMLFSTELRVFKPDSAPDRWQIEMPALHAIVFGDTPKETFREALRVIAERGAEREIMKEKKHGD